MSQALFKSSVTSRRFPALSSLTADDVEVMVMKVPEKGASSRASSKGTSSDAHLFNPNLVKPSAVASLSSPGKPASSAKTGMPAVKAKGEVGPRPPFVPCNPSQARDKISLGLGGEKTTTGFVGMHSPYDSAHRMQMAEREDATIAQIGGVFVPASAARAKAQVAVNYYLNSPDAETLEAEKAFIQERAQLNLANHFANQQKGSKVQTSAAGSS